MKSVKDRLGLESIEFIVRINDFLWGNDMFSILRKIRGDNPFQPDIVALTIYHNIEDTI